MYRVIQFSTGNVGREALRMIIARPDLELVGVHAASPAKIGRDAAELCGLGEPTGITATDDLDALVALGADCVVFTAQAETRPDEALAQMCAFLRAGTDVVATSFVWLVNPRSADAWLLDPLREACEEGGSSLYVNGIDPGYSGDTLALAALSLAGSADRVVIQEVFDYADYDDGEFTGVQFGFGLPADAEPALMATPGIVASIWGGSVHLLAEAMGITLDSVSDRWETWVTPTPIDCVMTKVEANCVAAVRFAAEGFRDGRAVIVVEHVNRLTPAAAPDWAYPPEGRDGVHRVLVEGHPGIEINSHVGGGEISETFAGVVSTAARVVNAIAAVRAADPGILGVVDLPAGYAGRVMS
ncbi:NAD(P)H-dependent amine dehydrogenase family protein [Nocardia bovistercoris]|uniref:Dihydrodipicolinate reductase n=1 Tax=Nocardia bovistercoris TaxID=2785916 RepID=A0A931N1J4_9NOCA|nr:dihydrodipicolinate reductase [Nocardia bovistercoris]MBH0778460.1 dihydrodipicolinate reductase [Nocardia bovistercoris]